MLSKINSDFETLSYTEPNHKGCPVGAKGPLGWGGGDIEDIPDYKLIINSYLKGMEEDFVNVVKRLRENVGATDTNKRDVDSLIDADIRHHLYNLFQSINYAEKELGNLTKGEK